MGSTRQPLPLNPYGPLTADLFREQLLRPSYSPDRTSSNSNRQPSCTEREDWRKYPDRVLNVSRAWNLASQKYVGPSIVNHVGNDFYERINGLLPGVLLAFGTVFLTTLIGAVIGAAAGAFFGGAGAVPGAVTGATIGLEFGVWLLTFVGLGFLIVHVGQKISLVGDQLDRAVKLSWYSCGNQSAIDEAARAFGEAYGIFFALLVEATIDYLVLKGMTKGSATLRGTKWGKILDDFIANSPKMKREVYIRSLIAEYGPNIGELPKKNIRTVAEFLQEKGASDHKIREVLSGIDLHAKNPVEIITLRRGTVVRQYTQGNTGSWLVLEQSGVSGRNLGISDAGRNLKRFELQSDVQVIKSKAAHTVDTWTQGRARDVNVNSINQKTGEIQWKAGEFVSGGGTQFFLPDAPGSLKEF